MLSIHRSAALLAALCLAPFFAACASSGSNDVGNTTKTAGSMMYRDYTEMSTFKLISDSQLIQMGIPGATMDERRVSFDSTEQDDASTKVCHDDAIAGLLEAFEASAVANDAVDGPAPATAGDRDSVFEFVIDGRTRHVMKNSSSDRIAFIDFIKLYLKVYNEYQGHANVGDAALKFKQPKLSTRLGGGL